MLTRLRKHIAEPNYGVLALEMFVVIIGILIALGIDEWREDVEDAKVVREYMHQVITDLRATEQLVADRAQLNDAGDAAAIQLLTLFGGDESVEPEEISELFRGASNFSNPVPVLGTVEAIVATGDLRLVSDPVIRSKITRYLSTSRDYFLVPIYSNEDRHLTNIQNLAEIMIRYGIPLRSPEDQSRIIHVPNVKGFLTDAEAYAGVLSISASRSSFQRYRTSIAAQAAALRESLEKAVYTN